jgi:hypothetical protein
MDAVLSCFCMGERKSRYVGRDQATVDGSILRLDLDFRGHAHSDRAPNYNLAGNVRLAAIGRVVGHSLWACVAGVLSQINSNVRAVFFEDPMDLAAWQMWLGITYWLGICSATPPQYSTLTLVVFVMTV